MFQKPSLIRVGLCALLFVSLSATAAEWIKGQVVDSGVAGPGNGLAGVNVVIIEVATQKKLAETITTGSGHYAIEIDGMAKKKLAASFSKLGYFARPTIQELSLTQDVQPSIKLAREGAPEEYYKAIVDNIWKAKDESPDGTKAFFSAVSSLPAKEKAAVFDQIKLKDTSVFAEFVIADKAHLAAQKISAELKLGNAPGTEQAVFVYPNFGSAGTVWLYGQVPSTTDKKVKEDMVKSYSGIARVKSDVMVERTEAAIQRYIPN